MKVGECVLVPGVGTGFIEEMEEEYVSIFLDSGERIWLTEWSEFRNIHSIDKIGVNNHVRSIRQD